MFSKWAFEVKSSRREKHVHIINGIDQLRPPSEKSLALISFLVTKSNDESSMSLQDWVENIISKYLDGQPNLVKTFYALLIGYGYSRVHEEEYRKIKYDIYDGRLFPVNDAFPRLTTEILAMPLDSRISDIKYTIDLEGLQSIPYDKISYGNYFY
jgi:hypothetical protein